MISKITPAVCRQIFFGDKKELGEAAKVKKTNNNNLERTPVKDSFTSSKQEVQSQNEATKIKSDSPSHVSKIKKN